MLGRLPQSQRNQEICPWKLCEELSVMLKFFKRQKPVKLGRWQRQTQQSVIDRKIDLNNCDSCGTCGQKEEVVIKYLIVEGDVVHDCKVYKNITES